MKNSVYEIISDNDKLTIGKKFLEALKNRDWELMRSVLSPECVWTLPGTSLLSGPANGADAVIKRAGQLRDFGVMIEVKHILIGLQSVALSLHNTAKRGDLVLDQYVAIVCDLSGDKISKITTHLSDVEGINVFFVDGIIAAR